MAVVCSVKDTLVASAPMLPRVFSPAAYTSRVSEKLIHHTSTRVCLSPCFFAQQYVVPLLLASMDEPPCPPHYPRPPPRAPRFLPVPPFLFHSATTNTVPTPAALCTLLQRLREYMLLAANSFSETGPLLEEITGHLELRAERLSQRQPSSSSSSSPVDPVLDFNPWMGLRPLADLLKSLRESRVDQVGHPAAPIVARVCRAIMKQVILLEDEQLKKEGLEVRRRMDDTPFIFLFSCPRAALWWPGFFKYQVMVAERVMPWRNSSSMSGVQRLLDRESTRGAKMWRGGGEGRLSQHLVRKSCPCYSLRLGSAVARS